MSGEHGYADGPERKTAGPARSTRPRSGTAWATRGHRRPRRRSRLPSRARRARNWDGTRDRISRQVRWDKVPDRVHLAPAKGRCRDRDYRVRAKDRCRDKGRQARPPDNCQVSHRYPAKVGRRTSPAPADSAPAARTPAACPAAEPRPAALRSRPEPRRPTRIRPGSRTRTIAIRPRTRARPQRSARRRSGSCARTVALRPRTWRTARLRTRPRSRSVPIRPGSGSSQVPVQGPGPSKRPTDRTRRTARESDKVPHKDSPHTVPVRADSPASVRPCARTARIRTRPRLKVSP